MTWVPQFTPDERDAELARFQHVEEDLVDLVAAWRERAAKMREDVRNGSPREWLGVAHAMTELAAELERAISP